MSPWRMINEWGVPTVYLQCLTYDYVKKLTDKGKYTPDLAIAGGFTLEDQIFKGLSLGAPYFKLVGMARSPLTACMVGKTIAEKIKSGNIPKSIEKYGTDLESIFIEVTDLNKEFKDRVKDIPGSAIGLFSYYKRLEQGLKQFMAGARKFALKYIDRSDITSLTKEATIVSGIPYIMDADKQKAEEILNS